MATVTVSPKYQVVIPEAIRRALKLRPGQKLEALQHQDGIMFVPVRPARALRGFLPGLETDVSREPDRA